MSSIRQKVGIVIAAPVVVLAVVLLVPQARRAMPVSQPRCERPDAGLALVGRVRQLGTRHPIRVVGIGSDGRWVVACQARVDSDGDGRIHVGLPGGLIGDQLVPYLFQCGIGEGEPLEGFLDHSSDGRWIVVVRNGKLTVIDNLSGSEQAIPDADLSPGQGGYINVARLDHEQKRMLHFRGTDRHALVIRDLVGGRDLVVRASSPIAGIEPERNSPWVAIWFAVPPRPDGVVRDERFQTVSAMAHACESSGSFTLAPQETRPHDAWVNVETGEIKEEPAIVAHLRGQEVTQAADGAVRVGGTVIVPAACGAGIRIAAADPVRLIVSCRSARPGDPMAMFGPGMQVTLAGTDAGDDGFFEGSRTPRLIDDSPYVCVQRKACFALDDGRPIAVPGRPSEVRGPYILSVEGDKQLVSDARSGITTPLLPVTRMRSRSDRVERIGSLVVDFSLSPPRAVRELGREDEAVDDHGRVLSEALPPVDGMSWGPLRWSEPDL